MMRLFLLLLLNFTIYCSLAIPARIPRAIFPPESTQNTPNYPKPQFFEHQLKDHFNAHNSGHWAQRYYVNDTFWKKPFGPVFLMIEGEGAAQPKWAYSGHHMDMAKEFGAIVFSLEHRYYGASAPVENLSTENLQFLSSEQALADLAVFMDFIRGKYDLDIGENGRNRVIAFGGSYPGALAAWVRVKYPHLIYGSIASSAPVLAELDFVGYNQVVVASLANPVVGGSDQCAKNVFKAFQKIDGAFDSEKPEKLRNIEKIFNSCGKLETELDRSTFVGAIAGNFQGAVQYNGILPVGIKDVCNMMLNESIGSLEQRLAAVAGTNYSAKCTDFTWDYSLNQLNNVTVDLNATGVGIRQWTYQTCAQFGYYQTCEPWKGSCLFSRRMTLKSNTLLCKESFGLKLAQVKERIKFSNEYYGGNQPHATRIVFVNGDIDPWHYLSVLQDNFENGNDITAVYIPGASHCQNMRPSSVNDTLVMKEAKLKIRNKVAEWVQGGTQPIIL
jgi:serine protease 16